MYDDWYARRLESVREKGTMREENFCGLPRISCLSRVSSNRARVDVPVYELPGTSVSRSDIAPAWISAAAADHVGIRVDGEFKNAYRRDQSVDSGCDGCD